jgi:hypothetical protein
VTSPSADVCEPWATIADVGSPCDDYAFDPTLLEDSLLIASTALYHLTGRHWPGLCEDTVRPCGYRRPDSCGCLSSRTCGCRRLSELRLPGVVAEVGEVKIDGEVVAPARYRVDDHRWLVYLPESDTAQRQGWPCCQRLDRPDTEPDTWSITYTHGPLPPVGGIRAAAQLGCQLALAFQPETVGDCRLPKNTVNVARQGITVALRDPAALFQEGSTGLNDVDLWINSVLLGAKRRRASVWVPGAGRQGIRRVGT